MENIELSVRTWTCGGDIAFLPCSHVGHDYRQTRENPQSRWSSSRFVEENGIRFAEVYNLDLIVD